MLIAMEQIDRTQVELELCFTNLEKIESLNYHLHQNQNDVTPAYLQVMKLSISEIRQALGIDELTTALECDVNNTVPALEGLKSAAVAAYNFIVDRIKSLLKFMFGRKGQGEKTIDAAIKVDKKARKITHTASSLKAKDVIRDHLFDFDLSKYCVSDKAITSLPDALALASEGLKNSIHLVTALDQYLTKCIAYPTTDLTVYLDETDLLKHNQNMVALVSEFLGAHNQLKPESNSYRMLGGGVITSNFKHTTRNDKTLATIEGRESLVVKAIENFTMHSSSITRPKPATFTAKIEDFTSLERMLSFTVALKETESRVNFNDMYSRTEKFLESLKTLMEAYKNSKELDINTHTHLTREVALQRRLIQSLISKQLAFSVLQRSVSLTDKLLGQLQADINEIKRIDEKLDLTKSHADRLAWVKAEWEKYRK